MNEESLALLFFPFCILAGALTRMGLRYAYGARGPMPNDLAWDIVTAIGWALIGIGLLPLLILLAISRVGLILLLVVGITVVELIVTRRDTKRRNNAALLGLLTEPSNSLESAAIFADSNYRGSLGRDSRLLLNSLAEGATLRQAVLAYPGALPREAAAYAAVGDLSRDSAAAMRELGRSGNNPLVGLNRNLCDRAVYLLIVVTMLLEVVAYLMIEIVPQFRQIFQEFDLPLPKPTELVIAVSNYFSQFWVIPFLLVAATFLVITLFVAITTFADVTMIPSLIDRLTANRHIATLYRLLSLALERRVPLAPVFDALGHTLPAKFLRERISVASHDLQAGVDWIEALRRQGITTPVELGLLQAGQAAGNAGWTLRALADRRDRYWTYRLTAITQFVFPLLVLLIGALVAIVVIGIFIPVIALIVKLA